MRHFFVYILALLPSASAIPLSLSRNSSGSACLAVVVTVTLILTVLTILKHIFMRNRRLATRTSSPRNSAKLDNSYNSSYSSAFSLPSIKIQAFKPYCGGFWVGFFGSPRSETRFNSNTSSTNRKHPYQSRDPSKLSSRSRRSSAISKGSVVSVGKSGLPVSTIVESRALYNLRDGTGQTRPRSLRLPSYPAKAYTKSFITRRFSAPADGRASAQDTPHKKRHSSLKSVRSRRSDVSGIRLGNASLRLVDPTSYAEPPLPLSPKMKYTPKIPHQAAPFSPRITSPGSFDGLPYQAPLPSRGRKRPGLPAVPSPRLVQQSLDRVSIQISHPYALAPTAKGGEPLRQFKPRYNFLDMTDVDSSPIPPLPCCQPLSQAKPHLPPLPNYSPLVPGFKPKPKPRTVTPRVRKSPVIGPSPLRVMTLPEAQSSNTLSGNKSSTVNPATRPRSDFKVTDDDEAALLGIIQELIDETSDWDPSLFMDANFKSLLQDSSLTNGNTSSDPIELANTSKRSGSTGADGSSGSSNHSGSDELDLGLLGIDFCDSAKKASGPVAISSRNGCHSSENGDQDFVSFWHDEGWEDNANAHNSDDSVGLAV